MAKKAPCEYCEIESWQNLADEDGVEPEHGQATVELYPGNILAVTVDMPREDGECDELRWQMPMHYCPNCGRRLDR